MSDAPSPLRLNLDEAVILLIGVRLLGEMVETIEINGRSQERLIPALIDKLAGVVPQELQRITGEIIEEILVSHWDEGGRPSQDDEDDFPGPMYAIERTLPVLMDAISAGRTVAVDYYSMASEDVGKVHLDPYGIKQVGDLYWVVAYAHERGERSVFRVDRIKSLAVTDRTFDKPDSFRIDEFFADDAS
ncbi:MAG: WYL domain-containing protein [Candidatus Sericytochromatia bacterium]|nr:WYL domain-containing protein [Candidatus Sericytochromatia bacterium]